MASLSSLSNELKLLIIEYLAASPPPLPEPDPEEQYPPITFPKANASLVNLSCVNRSFRSLVAPFLFRRLILHNTEKSGTSITLIAKSPYARFVQQIEFEGLSRMPPDPMAGMSEADEIEYAPKPEDLPATVEAVLSELGQFPKLEELGVEFTFVDGSYEEGFYHFEEVEDLDQMENAEAKEGWRALMNKTYEALTRNSPGAVKALTLRNLPAKVCSIWQLKPWQDFLSELSSFSLSLRGGDNGVGWHQSTNEGYREFVNTTDRYFWMHTRNLTHFSLSATEDGPVGIDIYRVAPLPFLVRHFWKLQSISLDYVFIGTAVLNALLDNCSTLRAVKLDHVYASADNYAPRMMWSEFFGLLARARPQFPNLVEFEVISTVPGWQVEADVGEGERGKAIEDSRLDGGRVALRYAWMDDKYGFIRTDFGHRDAELKDQAVSDQIAHLGFMQIVKENKRRTGRC